MIRKGQLVHLKPEWQDKGDDQFTWVAVKDEDGGRVKIMPVIPNLEIQPVTVVETKMLVESDGPYQ
jgi:hypothetical protein